MTRIVVTLSVVVALLACFISALFALPQYNPTIPKGYSAQTVLKVSYGKTPGKVGVSWGNDGAEGEYSQPLSVEQMKVIGDRFYFYDNTDSKIKLFQSPGKCIWESSKFGNMLHYAVSPKGLVYAVWGTGQDQLWCIDSDGITLWTRKMSSIWPKKDYQKYNLNEIINCDDIEWTPYGLTATLCASPKGGGQFYYKFALSEDGHVNQLIASKNYCFVGPDRRLYYTENRQGGQLRKLVIEKDKAGKKLRELSFDFDNDKHPAASWVGGIKPDVSGDFFVEGKASLDQPYSYNGVVKGKLEEILWRFDNQGKFKEQWRFLRSQFKHLGSEIVVGSDGGIYHLQFGAAGIEVVKYNRSTPAQANQGSWEYKSQASILKVLPVTDGGAFISTKPRENNGKILPGANTIYRINPSGSVTWKYTPPEGYYATLLDSTPDGRYVLASIDSPKDYAKMDLLLLDKAGKVISKRNGLESSNWVWLSPDSKSVLRWIDSKKNAVLEDSRSGKVAWDLDSVTAGINHGSTSFVQPSWAARCVLVGDIDHGSITAVGIDGKSLWRVKNLKWFPYEKSPVVISSSGAWMLFSSATNPPPLTDESKDMEHYSYKAGGLTRTEYSDVIKLIKVQQNPDNPANHGQANVVWDRAITSNIITERDFPTRTAVMGGTILSLDLLDSQDKTKPYITVLTSSSVNVLEFDSTGSLLKETSWPVSDVAGVYAAWLASPEKLVIQRWHTQTTPDAVQVLDRTGDVIWEKKPGDEIRAVAFDMNRNHLIVATPHMVVCYNMPNN